MANICELSSPATTLASEAWRAGRETVDFSRYQVASPREDGMPEIDLGAVRQVVDRAIDDFGDRAGASDSWLAPRLHPALRLSRREASRPGLWRHLGLVALPHYVRWRWGSESADKQKIAQPDRF